MNKKQIAIILGIVCILLTFSIAVQVKTIKNANITGNTSFKENSLRDEVLKMKEKYDNTYKELGKEEKELEEVRNKATQNDSSSTQKEEDIKLANTMIGLTEVTAKGVVITLKDSQSQTTENIDVSSLLVHDGDLMAIVNELKNAGAEAISINDQRIVTTSAITCDGNVVRINNEKVGTPFEIKAIGSPEALAGALLRPGGYIKYSLEPAGVYVDLKKSNNVTIPKYNGVINFEYAKTVE
ncbi:MAG: DUF881 domain-containing protein [Clostridia bacterium]